jgi:hypothetical protein
MAARIRIFLIALILFGAAGPARAQHADDEARVRAVIADWYKRVGALTADAPWVLLAPRAVDTGPGYSVPADLHSGAAVIRGPYLNHELAARAMQFAWEIDLLKVDAHFAKARVWERGYFFASAAQKTYETGVSTMFVLEKQPDGEWKILVHDASTQGIPPNKITNPMPDLRDLYYQRCGDACDPVADAKKAAEW